MSGGAAARACRHGISGRRGLVQASSGLVGNHVGVWLEAEDGLGGAARQRLATPPRCAPGMNSNAKPRGEAFGNEVRQPPSAGVTDSLAISAVARAVAVGSGPKLCLFRVRRGLGVP